VAGVVVQALLLGSDFLLSVDSDSKCLPGFAGPPCVPNEIATVPVGGDAEGVVHRLPSCVASNVVSVDSSIIVSGCGTLFRSDNGGATWQRLPFPSPPRWCTCGTTLLAANSASDLWAMVPQGSEPMQSQDKATYRSLDEGATWSLVDRSTPESQGADDENVPVNAYASMLVATSDQHALLVSSFGPNFVSATFDGGSSWVTRRVPGASGGLVCLASQRCWAASWSTVLRTEDGGRRWSEFSFKSPRPG
jgi:photosystem II stability/assembly factor-like uncharacterized protein